MPGLLLSDQEECEVSTGITIVYFRMEPTQKKQGQDTSYPREIIRALVPNFIACIPVFFSSLDQGSPTPEASDWYWPVRNQAKQQEMNNGPWRE